MDWDLLEHFRFFHGETDPTVTGRRLLPPPVAGDLLTYWSQTPFLGDFAGLGVIIIGLSVVVTTLTGISMSAICTNGVVRGGKSIHLLMTTSLAYGVKSTVGLMLEGKFSYS